MTRLRTGLALLLAAVASACAGLRVGGDDGCEAACATADLCGFLPSNLGYGEGEDAAADALADCRRRCADSPREDPVVAALLACLGGTWDGETEQLAWCADAASDQHARGDTCNRALACLEDEFRDDRVVAEASLTVSLISFVDFETYFGAGAVAALYTADREALQTCAPALCGEDDCASEAEDLPCDATMCRRAVFKANAICEALRARTLDLVVLEREQIPATQVLLDETDITACDVSSATFTADEYQFLPGPLLTSARVSGAMPQAQLEALAEVIGQPIPKVPDDPNDTDDAGDVPYCLQFIGMAVIARGGENEALVPIGGPADILEYAATPQFCERGS